MAKSTTDPVSVGNDSSCLSMMFIKLHIELPPGWSNAPEDLDYDSDWATSDGDGQVLCALYHLGKGRPIMWNDDACYLMFEAGGKLYIWSRLTLEVYEIVSPADLDGIIEGLKEKGLKAMKLKIL